MKTNEKEQQRLAEIEAKKDHKRNIDPEACRMLIGITATLAMIIFLLINRHHS